jgi:hypothetical protein
VFVAGEEANAAWGIRWGSIRQRRDLPPKRQIWCRSALPWVEHIGEVPAKPTD